LLAAKTADGIINATISNITKAILCILILLCEEMGRVVTLALRPFPFG